MTTTAPTIFVLINNEEGISTVLGAYSTMDRAKEAAADYRKHEGYDPVAGWVAVTDQDWVDEAGIQGDDYHLSITARTLDV